jgi:hypothetical protein
MIRIKEMEMPERLLTVTDIKEICDVPRRTVTKWFDAHRLQGERDLNTYEWQTTRSELVKFLEAYNFEEILENMEDEDDV